MKQNHLSGLNIDLPALEQTAEGQLRGGFAMLGPARGPEQSPNSGCSNNILCSGNTTCGSNNNCKGNTKCAGNGACDGNSDCTGTVVVNGGCGVEGPATGA